MDVDVGKGYDGEPMAVDNQDIDMDNGETGSGEDEMEIKVDDKDVEMNDAEHTERL